MQNANSEKPFIVARPFSAGGCAWSKGQIFDSTICSERLLRVLRDQRKIVREGEPLVQISRQRAKWLGINHRATLSRQPTKVRIRKRAIKPDTEWNGEEGHIYYRHAGKGKYRVFEGEIALTDPMKKHEAEAEAARIIGERRHGSYDTPTTGTGGDPVQAQRPAA